MTITDLSVAPKPEPKRNRWGQYVLPVDGKERGHQRVTTFAKLVADTYHLNRWSERMGGKGLAARPDLLAQVAATPLDKKDELNAIIDAAKEFAGSSVGRNDGSAIHAFTEQLDRGQKVTAPAPYDRDIAAYGSKMTMHGITVLPDMIERVVRIGSLEVAGTFDRVNTASTWVLPRIGDVKSAQVIYGWLEIAVQLACYSRADAIWDVATETYEPMPAVDQSVALVMHVPARQGVCTLYEVDIEAGWEIAQIAADVRAARKRKNLANVMSAPSVASSPDGNGGTTEGPVATAPALLVGQVPLSRATLQARVEALNNIPGAIGLLGRELKSVGLPRLGACVDSQLPSWAHVVSNVEAKVEALFMPAELAPFAVGTAAPPDPFAGLPSSDGGHHVTVAPDTQPTPSSLRERYDALPVDLRLAVDASRAGTILEGRNIRSRCTVKQAAVADGLLCTQEIVYEGRKAYVAALLQGLDDATVASFVATLGPLVEFTDVDVERLEALCGGLP